MPIESNTSSKIGQNGWKRGAKAPVASRGHGETRWMVPAETPRERMLRVVKTVKQRK